MTGFDYAIVAILAISSVLSLIRGFVREAISLVVWIVAGAVALTFAPKAAPALAPLITVDTLRIPAAFLILFIIVIVLGSIVSFVIGHALSRGGLSGTDRVVGLVFGFARGVVIIAVLVLLGGLTPLTQEAWWRNSQLVPYMEPVAGWLRGILPSKLGVVSAKQMS